MTVVVIGDRQVGKTSMVVRLYDPGTQYVRIVTDLTHLYNEETGETPGTRSKGEESFTMDIELPTGQKSVQLRWIDTPGEAWSNSEWKKINPNAWQDIKQEVNRSHCVLLLLPPSRNLVKRRYLENEDEIEDYPRMEAWKNNVRNWLNFFQENCRRVPHLLISIHKADLFCNVEELGKQWQYDPYRPGKWIEYNNYVKAIFFDSVNDLLKKYQRNLPESDIRFFVTTINNPSLLELPWIYAGTYLAYSRNV